MRESDDVPPMPGHHGSTEEASSETIDRISEVVNNFPASMQVSTALEPLQGEMTDNFQGDAAADSPVGLTVREMRRAGLTSETIWGTVAARRKKKATGSRPASLQMPPNYHVGVERAELLRGRKRAVVQSRLREIARILDYRKRDRG
jgi:hypothetical protein